MFFKSKAFKKIISRRMKTKNFVFKATSSNPDSWLTANKKQAKYLKGQDMTDINEVLHFVSVRQKIGALQFRLRFI